jgi:hypothetical protein
LLQAGSKNSGGKDRDGGMDGVVERWKLQEEFWSYAGLDFHAPR